MTPAAVGSSVGWGEHREPQHDKFVHLDHLRARTCRYFVGVHFIHPNLPGFTITREDIRENYGEKRMVTFGLLNGEAVVLVHTDRHDDMHIISLRKAEKYEARYYFKTAEDYFRKGR